MYHTVYTDDDTHLRTVILISVICCLDHEVHASHIMCADYMKSVDNGMTVPDYLPSSCVEDLKQSLALKIPLPPTLWSLRQFPAIFWASFRASNSIIAAKTVRWRHLRSKFVGL